MEELMNIPNHVVIIPDGNRRWAKEKGLEPWEGHEEGAKRTEEIIREASKIGVKHLSIWGSSLDNLTKRPFMEKKALLDIYKRYFEKLIESKDVYETETRINVIGRWREQFPDSIKNVIERCIDRTKNFNKNTLSFFLAYNGDDEMIQAIKDIVRDARNPEEVGPDFIKSHLMTKDLPPVDFVIRTGGEPHWSAGFMMWDVANAELFFCEDLFPDFGAKSFKDALSEYGGRSRKGGK